MRPRRPPSDPRLRGYWEELTHEGIAVTTFTELFGDDPSLGSLVADARKRRSEWVVSEDGGHEDKPYKGHLLGGHLETSDVYLKVALHPSVLSLVTAYLGVVPLLRAADIWLTTPSSGLAVQTQLWHRDGDDHMNVKLFAYLSDVTISSGPFCFAPRTHPLGDVGADAEDDGKGRTSDAQMSDVLSESRWQILTGPPGTVVLTDTCGYHKQLKPEDGERLLFMAQYTTHRPNWPPALSVAGSDRGLTRAQRRVLPT